MTAEEKKSPHLRSETTDSEVRLVEEEFLQAKDLIKVILLFPAFSEVLRRKISGFFWLRPI
jgi:hypothetical protein